MSQLQTHSLADVTRSLFIATGVLSAHDSGVQWSSYVNHLPDTDLDTVTLYDTDGTKDARRLKGGSSSTYHHGLQVRIRARDYEVAYAKAKVMSLAMDLIYRNTLVHETLTYRVQCYTLIGTMINVGRDVERFQNFTLNAISTYEEVT